MKKSKGNNYYSSSNLISNNNLRFTYTNHKYSISIMNKYNNKVINKNSFL